MLPEEMQTAMAKILFLVFATILLCLNRVKADTSNLQIQEKTNQTTSISCTL